MFSQQGRQGQQQPEHLSKHCSKIRNIIAIARQGQEIILKNAKIYLLCSCHNAYANPDANVRNRFIHVKQIETPSFWGLLQQLLPQTDFVDAIGPIVQIENSGSKMMGGNFRIVFNVPFKPLDIINTPSA